jgi:hypothetical protein
MVNLSCIGDEDNAAVADALWDAAVRYWVPNHSAHLDAQISVQEDMVVVRASGSAPGGGDKQELCISVERRREPVVHEAMQELGPRLRRLQTPVHLILQLPWQYKQFELDSFVRGLSGHGPKLHLRNEGTLRCFLTALEGVGDGDEEEATFNCVTDLTIDMCTEVGNDYGLDMKTMLSITNHWIGRLCRALERRRASGAATLRSVTFIKCPDYHNETIRELLRTYDENLLVTIESPIIRY